MAAILPEATLGMLGGGQLGKMFTTAAQTMGYRVVVLDPDPHSPAGAIAQQHLCAAYDDASALQHMAEQCAAITTEFENIPASTLAFLAEHTVVHPSASALAQTQNRIIEKQFVQSLGIPTVPFAPIYQAADLAQADIAYPAILKVATFGYDGKGQRLCADLSEAQLAFAEMGHQACVLEQRIALQRELSVVLARAQSGEMTAFPVAENEHVHGILHATMVPAQASAAEQATALEMAQAIAEGLGYVGTLAVEFFVTQAGAILVNEIAPRPHNSGHFTLDACITSQFEQQVRMLCGLPSGDPSLLKPVVMINLLGDVWGRSSPNWPVLLASPSTKLHLYGKREARPGRKMGHFTVLADDVATARHTANALFAALPPPD